MDITTVVGLVVALGAILAGQVLEGGHLASILQGTAAVIVLGGTAGATMVAFPLKDFLRGLRMAGAAFQDPPSDVEQIIAQLVELAIKARRDGVIALEGSLETIADPFLRRATGFLVDGIDAKVMRDALETEIASDYEENLVGAKVFESAGGFSPTIGILGAVLGLIHVMENLSDPGKLGAGIAVAFVATIYGVGFANLVLIPISTKLKRRLVVARDRKTLIAEGVLSIQEGLNPRILDDKLRSYTGQVRPAVPAKPGGAPAAAKAT
jgi:chemotaxis protein MotA